MSNLRQLRLHRGLGCAELAKRAGITRAYVHHLEAGARRQPSLGVLNALADALELDAAERAEFILSFALRPVGGRGGEGPTDGAGELLQESA